MASARGINRHIRAHQLGRVQWRGRRVQWRGRSASEERIPVGAAIAIIGASSIALWAVVGAAVTRLLG